MGEGGAYRLRSLILYRFPQKRRNRKRAHSTESGSAAKPNFTEKKGIVPCPVLPPEAAVRPLHALPSSASANSRPRRADVAAVCRDSLPQLAGAGAEGGVGGRQGKAGKVRFCMWNVLGHDKVLAASCRWRSALASHAPCAYGMECTEYADSM